LKLVPRTLVTTLTTVHVCVELALSGSAIKGDPVPGADFFIHTVFVEGAFMSSGVLTFPPGATKPSRNSSKHALVPLSTSTASN
jgi:hypothetical protein